MDLELPIEGPAHACNWTKCVPTSLSTRDKAPSGINVPSMDEKIITCSVDTVVSLPSIRALHLVGIDDMYNPLRERRVNATEMNSNGTLVAGALIPKRNPLNSKSCTCRAYTYDATPFKTDKIVSSPTQRTPARSSLLVTFWRYSGSGG